jgi:hypothetical protein
VKELVLDLGYVGDRRHELEQSFVTLVPFVNHEIAGLWLPVLIERNLGCHHEILPASQSGTSFARLIASTLKR